MFFYFDPWYLLLVLPAVILAGIAQLWVQSTFRKYSKVGTLRGVTGPRGVGGNPTPQRDHTARGTGRRAT